MKFVLCQEEGTVQACPTMTRRATHLEEVIQSRVSEIDKQLARGMYDIQAQHSTRYNR